MTLEMIPDMVHLTIGGLYAGVGGGAASFRYGALHHTVVEVDVLTSDGQVITCSAHSHRDLFAALPGSLGTFGYALRLRLRIKRAGRYVMAKHTRLESGAALMAAFETKMTEPMPDFLDGVIYSANESLLIEGSMTDEKPMGARLYSLSETGMPYAIIAREGGVLWFELIEFIYKWDPDGYFSTWETPEWTRNPKIRSWAATLFPWYHRSDWLRELFSLLWGFDLKKQGSHMCVDFQVPLNGSVENLQWFDTEVGVYPLYMAPINITSPPLVNYVLYKATLPAVDVGIGYGPMGNMQGKRMVIRTRKNMEKYFGEVEGGTRLQYTNIDLGDTEDFWKLFPAGARDTYQALKAKYDPRGIFPDIVMKLNKGAQNSSSQVGELALRNVAADKFLNVWEGNRAHGAVVGPWGIDDDNSLWNIQESSWDSTTIRSAQTGAYLSVWGGVSVEGAAVRMSTYDLGDASHWSFHDRGNGSFVVCNLLNKLYLNVDSATQTILTSADEGRKSTWELVPFKL